jgi:hypothetical protein
MCWWVPLGRYIKSKDDCRNLAALIFQQYRMVSGERLISYTDDKKTQLQLPHHILHDDRCAFVAVIAAIVNDEPTEFKDCVIFAKKLKKHNVDKKDCEESEILYDSIIAAISKSADIKDEDLDVNIAKHIRIFTAVLNAAIHAYIKTGPTGSFHIKYLFMQI